MPERRGHAPDNIDREKIVKDLDNEDEVHNYYDFVKESAYRKIFEGMDLKGKKIIDLGAGFIPFSQKSDTARHLAGLEDKGEVFIPIDVRELQARSWRLLPSHTERDGSSIEPVVANAFELPFADNSVDGCMSINFLNSFGRKSHYAVADILTELHRVLRPGAFVVISNYGYFRRNTETGHWLTNNKVGKKNIITEAFIKEVAEKLGFHNFKELELDKNHIIKATKEVGSQHEFGGRKDLGTKTQLLAPVGVMFVK